MIVILILTRLSRIFLINTQLIDIHILPFTFFIDKIMNWIIELSISIHSFLLLKISNIIHFLNKSWILCVSIYLINRYLINLWSIRMWRMTIWSI